MRFSVFTASLPDWSPIHCVGILADQGWDGIEWRVVDQEPTDEVGFWAGNRATWPLTGLSRSAGDLARLTRQRGLEISGIGGYAPCNAHEDVETLLAATSAMGAGKVRIRVPNYDPDHDYRDQFAAAQEDFSWAARRAAQHGVKILVEIHHGTLTPSASAAMRLVEGLDPEAIGVIHDAGNLVIEGQENTLAAFQLLGPYLAHIHVKNALWRPAEATPGRQVSWQHEWAPLQSGIADLPEYFRALRTVGYDDWVVVEDFSTTVPLEERTRGNLEYVRRLAVHDV